MIRRHGLWASIAVCAALANPWAGLLALPFVVLGAALTITLIVAA